MSIDWNAALKYARLVKLAESVRPEGGYGPRQIAALQDLDYKFVAAIYGSDLATNVHPNAADVVTFGFIALSTDDELLVAIRGTDTLLEWVHDAEFLMVLPPIPGSGCGATDDGFTSAYKSLRVGDAKEGPTVAMFLESYIGAKLLTIAGHSLGAALATLLALDAGINTPFSGASSPLIYTFASPRVGDHLFAKAYNDKVPNTFRVANTMDAVTMLPPVFPLPYMHVGIHCELKTVPPLLDGIACLHHLTSYQWLIAKLAGASGYDLDYDCIDNSEWNYIDDSIGGAKRE